MIYLPQNILAQGDISNWLTSIFFLGFISAFQLQSHDKSVASLWRLVFAVT